MRAFPIFVVSAVALAALALGVACAGGPGTIGDPNGGGSPAPTTTTVTGGSSGQSNSSSSSSSSSGGACQTASSSASSGATTGCTRSRNFRCGMDNIVIRCSCPGGTCTCTKNGADAGTPAFGACGDQTSLCNADSFPLAECGVSL